MAIVFKDYVGGTFNQVLQRVNVINVANYRWKKYQYGDAGVMSTPQGRTYKTIIAEEGENNIIKIPKLHEGGSWTFEVDIFNEKHSFRFELPAYEGEPDTLYLFIYYDTPTVKGSQQLTPVNIKSDEYFYFILGNAVNNLTSDLPDIFKQYFTGYLLWLMPQQTFNVWGDNNYYFTDIGYYSGYGKIDKKLELKGKIPIKDNTEQPGGGQGGGEMPNEPIEDEELADSLIIDSNLLTIYNPQKLTVLAISDFLNSGSFLDLWKHKSEAIQSVIS